MMLIMHLSLIIEHHAFVLEGPYKYDEGAI